MKEILEEIEVSILALVAGGFGRAVHDGCQVFLPFVAPGDRVRAKIVRRHKSYIEAVPVEILEASAVRTKPRCPVFGECGGCQWQHMDYGTQVVWKREILEEQLVRLGGLREPRVLPTVAALKPWHYRQRIQLQLGDSGEVGFYRRDSKSVVEFEHCYIADEKLNDMLPAAREQLRTTGNGRHLRLDGVNGFAQVNAEQNVKMCDLLLRGISARKELGVETVLELYCGSGNFSFPLTQVVGRVIAVDDHAESIELAQKRAFREGFDNLEFRATSAGKIVRRLSLQGIKVNGVVLDPPRRGAAEVMADLLLLKPAWIAYISCDPATLARDVRTLCASGYKHESSQPIDMFPQTFHIESLTWLSLSE